MLTANGDVAGIGHHTHAKGRGDLQSARAADLDGRRDYRATYFIRQVICDALDESVSSRRRDRVRHRYDIQTVNLVVNDRLIVIRRAGRAEVSAQAGRADSRRSRSIRVRHHVHFWRAAPPGPRWSTRRAWIPGSGDVGEPVGLFYPFGSGSDVRAAAGQPGQRWPRSMEEVTNAVWRCGCRDRGAQSLLSCCWKANPSSAVDRARSSDRDAVQNRHGITTGPEDHAIRPRECWRSRSTSHSAASCAMRRPTPFAGRSFRARLPASMPEPPHRHRRTIAAELPSYITVRCRRRGTVWYSSDHSSPKGQAGVTRRREVHACRGSGARRRFTNDPELKSRYMGQK